MSRRRQIYEGKAKILYEGPEPGTLIQYFKDDATAFNAQKRGTINGKGVLNNRISEHIFTSLATIGVPTHFIRRLNMREQLIRQVEIVPIEVVVRNVAAVLHAFGFTIGRCHGAAVQVIAPDDNRGGHLAGFDQAIKHLADRRAFAVAQPTNARRQALEMHAALSHVEPAMQGFVIRK